MGRKIVQPEEYRYFIKYRGGWVLEKKYNENYQDNLKTTLLFNKKKCLSFDNHTSALKSVNINKKWHKYPNRWKIVKKRVNRNRIIPHPKPNK